jgi:hypothetical protein
VTRASGPCLRASKINAFCLPSTHARARGPCHADASTEILPAYTFFESNPFSDPKTVLAYSR